MSGEKKDELDRIAAEQMEAEDFLKSEPPAAEYRAKLGAFRFQLEEAKRTNRAAYHLASVGRDDKHMEALIADTRRLNGKIRDIERELTKLPK
jgi:hypothetical protein